MVQLSKRDAKRAPHPARCRSRRSSPYSPTAAGEFPRVETQLATYSPRTRNTVPWRTDLRQIPGQHTKQPSQLTTHTHVAGEITRLKIRVERLLGENLGLSKSVKKDTCAQTTKPPGQPHTIVIVPGASRPPQGTGELVVHKEHGTARGTTSQKHPSPRTKHLPFFT